MLRDEFPAESPARLDPHVAAIDPAQVLQALQERPHAGLPFGIVRGHEDA